MDQQQPGRTSAHQGFRLGSLDQPRMTRSQSKEMGLTVPQPGQLKSQIQSFLSGSYQKASHPQGAFPMNNMLHKPTPMSRAMQNHRYTEPAASNFGNRIRDLSAISSVFHSRRNSQVWSNPAPKGFTNAGIVNSNVTLQNILNQRSTGEQGQGMTIGIGQRPGQGMGGGRNSSATAFKPCAGGAGNRLSAQDNLAMMLGTQAAERFHRASTASTYNLQRAQTDPQMQQKRSSLAPQANMLEQPSLRKTPSKRASLRSHSANNQTTAKAAAQIVEPSHAETQRGQTASKRSTPSLANGRVLVRAETFGLPAKASAAQEKAEQASQMFAKNSEIQQYCSDTSSPGDNAESDDSVSQLQVDNCYSNVSLTMPLPRKRGRKAQDGYLETAEDQLKKLKVEYGKAKDGMGVKERAKHRNRISALESRIKKRKYQESMNCELDQLKDQIGNLRQVLINELDDQVLERVLQGMTKGAPMKRRKHGKFTKTINTLFNINSTK